jgi:hypothetical protein
MAKFADIKRGGYFWYRNQQWKRTRGRWALPVRLISQGFAGFYFDLDTEVEDDDDSGRQEPQNAPDKVRKPPSTPKVAQTG